MFVNASLLFKACCIILLLSSSPAFSQTPKSAYSDSVIHHYLKERAFKVSLHSRLRERYIDSALVLLPHYAYLWQQRAMPLFKMRQYEAGMPFLDSAVKYDPARYLSYRAFMKCIFQKSYAASLADFDAAEKLTGNSGVMDHSYDFYRALCYLSLRQFSKAETLMQKDISLTTQTKGEEWVHYNDWFYMGVIRFEQEDLSGAAVYLDKCLKIFPRYPDAEYMRALCFAQEGALPEAMRLFVKAKSDSDAGYTSTEDNAFYEPYPYTVTRKQLEVKATWAAQALSDLAK